MNSTLEVFKLAELRAKTDRELVAIIDAELELGLRFAPGHLRAEIAYTNARNLLPKVEDLTQRRRLEAKLKRQVQETVAAERIARTSGMSMTAMKAGG
jgi:hypothetical protein